MVERYVRHYVGNEITPDIIDKVQSMAFTHYDDGVYDILYEDELTLNKICYWHDAHHVEQENLLLGEDWFVIYIKRINEIEIVEWFGLENVSNKFRQTTEMVNAMRNILLSGEGLYLLADMRHDTSYKFYQTLLKKEFLECYHDDVKIDPWATADAVDFSEMIIEKYGSLNEYFVYDEKEVLLEYDKYFYHRLSFGITDKFVKQYKKENRTL